MTRRLIGLSPSALAAALVGMDDLTEDQDLACERYIILDCAPSPGWFYDLIVDGERIEIDLIYAQPNEVVACARLEVARIKGEAAAAAATFLIVRDGSGRP